MNASERPEGTYPFSGNQRYFILCAGRTGSTLLAAILADAGARFGLDAPDEWDRNGGEMETPESHRAALHFGNAHMISAERPSNSFIRKLRWDIERHRGKRDLKKALSIADYIKCLGADLIVHPAVRLGYFPQVIVNYRRFEDHARSLFMLQAHSSVDWIAERYVRLYTNSLVLMSRYGGCVVSYDDVTGTSDTDCWLDCLAAVMSLPRDVLGESYARRVGTSTEETDLLPINDQRTTEIFEALQSVRNQVFPPSPQSIRNWTSRFGA